MAPQRPFDPTFLREYAEEHLAYEVGMFYAAVHRLARNPQGTPRNAWTEVFILHLRNLLDFLYPPPREGGPRANDVIAADYCLADAWVGAAPQKLGDARTQAHKQVAHLTSDRVSGDNPGKHWRYAELARELDQILAAFVRTASPALLSARAAAAMLHRDEDPEAANSRGLAAARRDIVRQLLPPAVIGALHSKATPWDVAIWFIEPNESLGGRTPAESWPDDQGSVLAAAAETHWFERD